MRSQQGVESPSRHWRETLFVFDLSAAVSIAAFEAAVREAEYLHRFPLQTLADILDLHPGQRGAATARVCLRNLEGGPSGRTLLNATLDLDGHRIEADWRDRRLQAAGWRVVRLIWRQLDEPDVVMRDLRRLLRAGEPASTAASRL